MPGWPAGAYWELGCKCCSVAWTAGCAAGAAGAVGATGVLVSGTRRKASSISSADRPLRSRKLRLEATELVRTWGGGRGGAAAGVEGVWCRLHTQVSEASGHWTPALRSWADQKCRAV